MKLLVAAHDAGGANQLIYRFRGTKEADFFLTGPAAFIADSIKLNYSSSLDLNQIRKYDLVYVGSNSKPQLSDRILSAALSQEIETVGVLEHWVNYSTRWDVHPDRVEVQDIRAFVGGLYTFGLRIRLSRNYYLQFLKSKVKSHAQENDGLLVILQLLGDEFVHAESNSCFCSGIENFVGLIPGISRITLREHANTPSALCVEYLSKSLNKTVTVSGLNKPIEDDLLMNGFVLGLDSYALYLARRLGKQVFSISEKRRSWFAPKYQVLP